MSKSKLKSNQKKDASKKEMLEKYLDIPESLLEQFSADSLQFYRSCFGMYDLDKDGLISAKELSQVSKKLGYAFSNDQIEELMTDWDKNSDGQLNFEEFVQAMPGNTLSISEEEHKEADIRRRFREFDLDGNGIVSFDEAHSVLSKELAFTRSQSSDLFNYYDKNGDKKLSYEEFVKFYRKISSKIEWIRLMFLEFDNDGSGSISSKECKKMLRGLNMSDAEIEDLLNEHDKSGDGELQYEEFVGFLMDGTP